MEVKVSVKLILHRDRHRVECTLCASCPLDKETGCCRISPSFYPSDLGYYLLYYPEILEQIVSIPELEIREHQISVKPRKDPFGNSICYFLSKEGCMLPGECRNNLCRLYICPGLVEGFKSDLRLCMKELALLHREERQKNQLLIGIMREKGLALNKDITQYLSHLKENFITVFSKESNLDDKFIKEERDFTVKVDIYNNIPWLL